MTKKAILFLSILLFVLSCNDDDTPVICSPSGDLSEIEYNPQDYNFEHGDCLPTMFIPATNTLTVDGVELGRHLFYDPILSADSSMACAGCHFPELSFSDGKKVSKGIDGLEGKRSAMSIINLGYLEKGLFWDGRVNTLEEQALVPVEDPIELHDTWMNVETKLRRHATYPTMFRKAFGIGDTEDITRDLAVRALAQFERSVVSFNSEYDKVKIKEEAIFSDSAERGFRMFFDHNQNQGQGLLDAECGHCHSDILFSNGEYFNNGLDAVNSLTDFEDWGRGLVTQDTFDNGKFRVPTLRNIALTAPYMHDGRFETLEEVIDFYNESPNHTGSNVDVNIRPLNLTEGQKQDLINFLHTLTDTVFTNNPAYQSPF